jgi:tetratricopeptide (TPR) repeat protein
VVLLFFAVVSFAVPVRAQQSLLEGARQEYNAGRYNRAVDLLAAAADKSPDDARVHFLLGQCYYQLRQYMPATKSFERSVALAPNHSEYHDWLGKAYGRRAENSMFLSAMGWARRAHKQFEIAVQIDPTNYEAQRDLIRYEMYAPGIVGGGDDRALKHIEALEKIDAIEGQLAHGEFLEAKRRFAEADAVYAKVLESGTDKIGVYLEVADYYRDRRNIPKMDQAIAQAERIDPSDRRLKFYQGILLVLKKSDLATAESLLKSYLATVPENINLPPHAAAHEWLGRLYEARGRYSEAAAEYRTSLAQDPHNKAVQEALKRVQDK